MYIREEREKTWVLLDVHFWSTCKMGLDAMGYEVNKRAQWEKKDKNCSFLTNQNKKTMESGESTKLCNKRLRYGNN